MGDYLQKTEKKQVGLQNDQNKASYLQAGSYIVAHPSGTVRITASSLNVRMDPSTTGKILGGLVKGAVVNYIDAKDITQIPLRTNSRWLKIKYNGKEGWVMTRYLSK